MHHDYERIKARMITESKVEHNFVCLWILETCNHSCTDVTQSSWWDLKPPQLWIWDCGLLGGDSMSFLKNLLPPKHWYLSTKGHGFTSQKTLILKLMVLELSMLQFQVKRQDHPCHNIFSRLFLDVRFCTHLCIAASLLWHFIMAYTLNLFLVGDIKDTFCHLKLLCCWPKLPK